MKLVIAISSIFFLSSCANYGNLCDAPSSEGWHPYEKPTAEMRAVFKAEELESKKIKWFKNDDGRVRVCEAFPRYSCASFYETYNPSNAKENEVMVSSCPNPY